MSKHNTLKKVLATAVVLGTAIYVANEYIIKKATSKNLFKREDGNSYSFKYGNVFYRISGEGKPVLLIHDMNECSSGMEWCYLENKLSKDHKVYTIDLLGCGRSDKPKLTYNSFLYVQLITDFINDIIGEPTDIIVTGKSVAAAVMAAKLKEESIDRMILINPSDLDDLAAIPDKCDKFKKALFTCPIIGTFIYHIMHRKGAIIDHFMKDYFFGFDEDYSELIEYYHEAAHKDKSGSKYLYASLQGGSLNMNIKHGVKVLVKDIIIISGSEHLESDYVPDEYAMLNDNVECITIMDTAYLPQLEEPGKVMDIIDEYWK